MLVAFHIVRRLHEWLHNSAMETTDSDSFYAYVRSKQNVLDKVGPLEDNAGNIITQGFVMAEELNMHFSSAFTREDICSLPVPETKFNESKGGGWDS